MRFATFCPLKLCSLLHSSKEKEKKKIMERNEVMSQELSFWVCHNNSYCLGGVSELLQAAFAGGYEL